MKYEGPAFTELHHAFVSASFYRYLAAARGYDGDAIFVLATRRYGEQRGCRMAQRALRDGRALDFAAYNAYGEWKYTEAYFAGWNHVRVVARSPDFRYRVHRCPWADAWRSMGLHDCAVLYCRQIDLAIARGFNPELVFRVRSIMHEGSLCDFELSGADLDAKGYSVDPATTQLPFEYHCGHLYTTFGRVVRSVMGNAGRVVCEAVAGEFSHAYGSAMAAVLEGYSGTDFDTLPEEHRDVRAAVIGSG